MVYHQVVTNQIVGPDGVMPSSKERHSQKEWDYIALVGMRTLGEVEVSIAAGLKRSQSEKMPALGSLVLQITILSCHSSSEVGHPKVIEPVPFLTEEGQIV